MREWIRSLPKVELHLHLEGAIPIDTLWQLIVKYNATDQVGSPAALAERFVYKDFPHFIDTWIWKSSFLREYEDFTLIAGAVAQDLADQNIRYVEASYSPGDYAAAGLKPGEITKAIRAGLNQVADRITVNLIADVNRNLGPVVGMSILEEIAALDDVGVIGIGLGGNETDFPPEPYEEVYNRARYLGWRTTAHAGEAAGPESVRGALWTLKAERIGHGTRAAEDPELLQWLTSEQVHVEMCPISNLRTGVVASLKEHPVRRFFDLGIPVSINTDDPKMFNNSLEDEFMALHEVHHFTAKEILQLLRNAINGAWCSKQLKNTLLNELMTF